MNARRAPVPQLEAPCVTLSLSLCIIKPGPVGAAPWPQGRRSPGRGIQPVAAPSRPPSVQDPTRSRRGPHRTPAPCQCPLRAGAVVVGRGEPPFGSTGPGDSKGRFWAHSSPARAAGPITEVPRINPAPNRSSPVATRRRARRRASDLAFLEICKAILEYCFPSRKAVHWYWSK